jgi:hypothetical protein
MVHIGKLSFSIILFVMLFVTAYGRMPAHGMYGTYGTYGRMPAHGTYGTYGRMLLPDEDKWAENS